MSNDLISVRAAGPSDFDDLAHLDASVWDHEEFVLNANGPAEIRHSPPFIKYAVHALQHTLDNPHSEIIVACDQTGTPVAYAIWTYFYEPLLWSEASSAYSDGEYPEGMNAQQWKDYNRICRDAERRQRDGKRHVTLNFLVVSPDHQRKGIGAMLLKHGLDKADEAKIPTYLGASPEGRGLYLKHGFEDIESFRMDLANYGGKGIMEHFFMVRPTRG